MRRELRAALSEYAETWLRLYRAIHEVSGGAVVVDSSKHSSLAFVLRTEPGIDLRVVHVVRDSRGVAYSWTKEVRRPEAGDDDGADDPLLPDPRLGAVGRPQPALRRCCGRTGTRTRLLRYEDFVAAPRPVLAELAGFAGLPSDDGPFVDDATVLLSPSHTVAGNPMRFRTGPIALRRDDAWRARLPRARRMLVSTLTAPLLARYGYLGRAGR